MAYQPDLDRLLTAGSRYADDTFGYLIEPHRLTDAVLPTGQIVGCDPLVSAADATPFTVTVPPGTYPVWAWVAVLRDPEVDTDLDHRRVAALQLVVVDEPAARWELALGPGQDTTVLKGDEFFGYGVDAGMGTLADVVALRAMSTWDQDRVEEVYIIDLPWAPVPGVIVAVTDEATGANVVSTMSGWGDGAYPTFIGYTADGRVASFVTDFLVAPAPASELHCGLPRQGDPTAP